VVLPIPGEVNKFAPTVPKKFKGVKPEDKDVAKLKPEKAAEPEKKEKTPM